MGTLRTKSKIRAGAGQASAAVSALALALAVAALAACGGSSATASGSGAATTTAAGTAAGTPAGTAGTASPTTAGSGASPTVSIPPVPAPVVGGAKFCTTLVTAETKLGELDLSSLAGATSGESLVGRETSAERSTFESLASKAPSAIKGSLSDLASVLGQFGTAIQTLESEASNPAAEEQTLAKVESLETGHLTADDEAIAAWVATHCT